ncbi:MAG: redox-sensing transcriptional repressor Rex [Firmicutes bacterium]|nr:redox-sensing transcriptional repressor Rex [Bacillota bacterium]
MPPKKNKFTQISKQSLQRLPYYLRYLHALRKNGTKNVSAPAIAAALRLHEVQVRKDLELVSTTGGKPRTGFTVDELIVDIERFLGYDNVDQAILVGAGKLGQALVAYRGFDDYGLQIIAAFDNDEAIVGRDIGDKPVFPISKMADLCPRLGVRIGILTVPADHAQQVCDEMIAAGILAIWNFTPVHLQVPENILVQNENMAASLALLRKHLSQKIASGEELS